MTPGSPAVELRLGKISRRLAQDLIGLAKLPVLALQRLEPVRNILIARRIVCRCRSRPSRPTHATLAAYSRPSMKSTQPRPSARHARPRAPEPSEPHESGLLVRICSSSCLSWLLGRFNVSRY